MTGPAWNAPVSPSGRLQTTFIDFAFDGVIESSVDQRSPAYVPSYIGQENPGGGVVCDASGCRPHAASVAAAIAAASIAALFGCELTSNLPLRTEKRMSPRMRGRAVFARGYV